MNGMTTIGDGLSAIALAGGIVGYTYIKNKSRQRRMEIVHQERMAALERGIPLPEFPLDLMEESGRNADAPVIPILGIVLATLALGAMVVMYMALPPGSHRFWIAPLPLAFMGVGLIGFHLLGTAKR